MELTGKAGAVWGQHAAVVHRVRIRFAPARTAVFSLTVLTVAAVAAHAAPPPVRFAGAVSGLVRDSVGRPQAGASVSLFNQQAHLLQRAYTDLAGNFSFGDLLPDLYSVQVSLLAFVPTTREKVEVHPGMRSLIQVSLSRMFSSIQVVSTVPVPGGLMSDDWKWTLRADSSLRPILRLLPSSPTDTSASSVWGASDSGTKTAVFHDSSALVKISATDTALTDATVDEADLGTQFAFATSLYSGSQVQVSGDVGYASTTGQPGGAIRTTFSHEINGDTPSVSVTMRQMSMPLRVGQGMLGGPTGESSLPTLRTFSVSMSDKAQLSDALSLVYGSQLDTITFLNRLQYFSPWVKMNYELPHGHLDMVFTSGNAQTGLASAEPNDGLQNELAALALMPRLSLMGGQVKVQRGNDYEIGYSQIVGAMEYRVSAYQEYVSNATMTIANPGANLFSGDLLPSMFSSSGLFDAGNISVAGYTVSATRTLSPNHKLTVAYGTLGVMTPQSDNMVVSDAESLRQTMTVADRRALTVRSAGVLKQTGTRYVASYQYADFKSAVPMASYSTQPDRAEPGLNIAIRQPISFIPGMAGHVEATADMRNLLAQGYLPVSVVGGGQILIVNAPRVFRGGLSFIF